MRLVPNDAPCMELGEVRRFQVKIDGAAGTNTISGTPTATCDTLTIGTVTASGLTISFTVTASETGTHAIMVEADLSSSETVRGFIRAKVVDSSTNASRASDY